MSKPSSRNVVPVYPERLDRHSSRPISSHCSVRWIKHVSRPTKSPRKGDEAIISYERPRRRSSATKRTSGFIPNHPAGYLFVIDTSFLCIQKFKIKIDDPPT